jgi:hypothetical protein
MQGQLVRVISHMWWGCGYWLRAGPGGGGPHTQTWTLDSGEPVQQTSDPHMGTGVGRGRAEQSGQVLQKARRKLQGKDLGSLLLVFLSVSPLFIPQILRVEEPWRSGGDWIHALQPSQQQRIKPTDGFITIIFLTHER